MIKIRDVNNNIVLVHPAEIISAYKEVNHCPILDLVEQHEIDLMKVSRVGSKLWLATIKIDDGKIYKHCNYESDDLKKAVIGVIDLKNRLSS